MLKLVAYAFNMQRLDKILRKKFPKEMTGKNTASLVRHWISDNAMWNACEDFRMYFSVENAKIRYLIKHPEELIQGVSNQSQSVQDHLSYADKQKEVENDSTKTDDLKQAENKYKDIISEHWKKDIIFTDVWYESVGGQQLDDSELMPGELSAIIFTVGCYTVRSTQRVYKTPKYNVPADEEEIAYVRKAGLGPLSTLNPYNEKLGEVHEITARHNNGPDGVFGNEFKYVCKAHYPKGNRISIYMEHINAICTVKESSLPSDNASLFVQISWVGDSRCGERWYQLDTHGVVTEFNH